MRTTCKHMMALVLVGIWTAAFSGVLCASEPPAKQIKVQEFKGKPDAVVAHGVLFSFATIEQVMARQEGPSDPEVKQRACASLSGILDAAAPATCDEVFIISTNPKTKELLMDCVRPVPSACWSGIRDEQWFLRGRHGDVVMKKLCAWSKGRPGYEGSSALWALQKTIIGDRDIASHNAIGLTKRELSRCVALAQDYRVVFVPCASKPENEIQDNANMIFGPGMTLRALSVGLESLRNKAIESERERLKSQREADEDDHALAHYVCEYDRSEVPKLLKKRPASEYFQVILRPKEKQLPEGVVVEQPPAEE